MDVSKRFGPQPFADPKPPVFYECGICGHFHPINWDGDCRDDANRFTVEDLDRKYPEGGWHETYMPGTTRYDWHQTQDVCVVTHEIADDKGEFDQCCEITSLPIECPELAEAMADWLNAN